MGLEQVDVPADGNSFFHMARFVLIRLRDWNISLVPTVAVIRTEVARFLLNARMNVIVNGRTLDELRADMCTRLLVASGVRTG